MKKIKRYNRKIISSVISISFSICTFIYCLSGLCVPVYAEDTNDYWDGYFQPLNVSSSAIVLDDGVYYTTNGRRFRANYKPSGSAFIYNKLTDQLVYTMCWYLGENKSDEDITIFRNLLKVYNDAVAANATTYQTGVTNGTSTQFNKFNITVGSVQRTYVIFYYTLNNITANNASIYSGYAKGYVSNYWQSGATRTMCEEVLKTVMGYQLVDNDKLFSLNADYNTYYKVGDPLTDGAYRSNVYDAFNNSNLYDPNNNSPGHAGNNSDGLGNGVPNGNGSYGASISFDGSDNQVQNQSQTMNQSQAIENGAVVINNTVSGGSGGSGGSGSGADQTVSGLEQAATGGWFDNLESAFSGVNQMINQLKNMPQLITGLFAFLPNELLNAITIMFGIMIPIVLIKVLV